MSKQNIVTTLMCLLIMSIIWFTPVPTSGAFYPINVTLTAPSYQLVGSSTTFVVTTNTRADISILVDGVTKKTCLNTYSCSYSYTPTRMDKYQIRASAFKQSGTNFYYGSAQKYMRSHFNPSSQQTWYTRSADHARSPEYRDYVFDTTVGIFDFYDSSIITPSEAIYYLYRFGNEYFINQYFANNGLSQDEPDGKAHAATAYQVAQNPSLQNYDGITQTTRFYDCADMASFLSGMAYAIGLPSRLTTLEVTYQVGPASVIYDHLFVEIYGRHINYPQYGIPNNNGWFVVDPSHAFGEGGFISSYSTLSDVRSSFYADEDVENFGHIWGMGSGDWGTNVAFGSTDIHWTLSNSGWNNNFVFYSSNPWYIS